MKVAWRSIFYPDLWVDAPGTDYHGMSVQVNGGWACFEVQNNPKPETIIDCRVVRQGPTKHPPGKRVWIQSQFLTLKPPAICSDGHST